MSTLLAGDPMPLLTSPPLLSNVTKCCHKPTSIFDEDRYLLFCFNGLKLLPVQITFSSILCTVYPESVNDHSLGKSPFPAATAAPLLCHVTKRRRKPIRSIDKERYRRFCSSVDPQNGDNERHCSSLFVQWCLLGAATYSVHYLLGQGFSACFVLKFALWRGEG